MMIKILLDIDNTKDLLNEMKVMTSFLGILFEKYTNLQTYTSTYTHHRILHFS